MVFFLTADWEWPTYSSLLPKMKVIVLRATPKQEQGWNARLIPSIASSNRFNCILSSYSGKTRCWVNLPSGLGPLCFSIGDWKRVGSSISEGRSQPFATKVGPSRKKCMNGLFVPQFTPTEACRGRSVPLPRKWRQKLNHSSFTSSHRW